MNEREYLIDTLKSVEVYLRNQDLSEIGMQVKGKVIQALNKVNKGEGSRNDIFCNCSFVMIMRDFKGRARCSECGKLVK